MEQTIRQRTSHGILLLVIREVILKGFTFVGQLLVFRLISPEFIGIFAIILFISNSFDLFSDLGFPAAIVQKERLITKEELSTMLLVKQILGFVIFFLVFFTAPLIISHYYHLPSTVTAMLRVFSLVYLIRPIKLILLALLERELAYEKIATVDIVGNGLYQIITVVCILKGLGVWSFIYATLALEFSGLFLSLFFKKFPFTFRFKNIRKFISFGVFVQGQSIATFLHTSISPLIVGRSLGSYSVGLLDFGQRAVSTSQDITDNFARGSFAGFSRMHHDEEETNKFITHSYLGISVFAILFTLIIVTLSKDILFFVFSSKWLPGLSAFVWFGFANCVNILLTPLSPLILAKGKSKALFQVTLIFTAFEWIFVFLLLGKVGIAIVPIANLIVALAAFVAYQWIVKLPHLKKIVKTIILPQVFVATILGTLTYSSTFITPDTLQIFLFKLLLLPLSYIALLYVFFPQLWQTLFVLLKKILHSLHGTIGV